MIYDSDIMTTALLTCPMGHHWMVQAFYTPATRWETETFDIEEDKPCPECGSDEGDTIPDGYVPVVEAVLMGCSVLCDGLRMAAAERCYRCGHHVDMFGYHIAGRAICGECAEKERIEFERLDEQARSDDPDDE